MASLTIWRLKNQLGDRISGNIVVMPCLLDFTLRPNRRIIFRSKIEQNLRGKIFVREGISGFKTPCFTLGDFV